MSEAPIEDRVAVALADALSAVPGLHESGYMLANPTTPAAEILSGTIEFDESFGRGVDRYNAVVRITVGTSLDIAAQRQLREFRSPAGVNSIKAAIEADRYLGGLVHDVYVARCSPIRTFRRPGGEVVLGCDFEVEFEASGTEI